MFCKIIKREIPAYIIDENKDVIVFLSLENHPLVVTKKHIENIYEMDEKLGGLVMREAIKIAKAVKKSLKPDGVQLVQANESAAHQDVFHFHLHVKPRWHNDGGVLHWGSGEKVQTSQQETLEKIKAAL